MYCVDVLSIFLQLGIGDCSFVGEIKPQFLRSHQRTFLIYTIAQNFAESKVKDMCSRVIAPDGISP